MIFCCRTIAMLWSFLFISSTVTMNSKTIAMIENLDEGGIVECSTTKGVQCLCFRKLSNLLDDSNSDAEVTKPLYYLVDEVSSQQVRDFESGIKHNETSKKNGCRSIVDERMHPRFSVLRHLLSTFFRSPLRSRRDNETASVTQVCSSTTDETDNHQKPKIIPTGNSGGHHSLNYKIKSTRSGNQTISKRFRILSVCSYSIVKNTTVTEGLYDSFGEAHESTRGGYLDSSSGEALGVAFAHPAFERRQHPSRFYIENPKKVRREILPILESNSGGTDDVTSPQTKAIVQTTTVDSWEATGSSSLYPTDEQSYFDEDSFDGFDSDDDIPFDEATIDDIKAVTARLGSRTQELFRIADSIPMPHHFFEDFDEASDESPLRISRQDSIATSDFRLQSTGFCNALDPSRLFYG